MTGTPVRAQSTLQTFSNHTCSINMQWFGSTLHAFSQILASVIEQQIQEALI
jgi:hypothetical protein